MLETKEPTAAEKNHRDEMDTQRKKSKQGEERWVFSNWKDPRVRIGAKISDSDGWLLQTAH